MLNNVTQGNAYSKHIETSFCIQHSNDDRKFRVQ